MNKKLLLLIIFILLISLSIVNANKTEDTDNNIEKKIIKSPTHLKENNTIKTSNNKKPTKTEVKSIKGTIGENITLKAHVTDSKGRNVTGGNIVFKLNGKTLRTDKKFNTDTSALKISVKNGIASTDIVGDLYLRNVKNITASYSGTKDFDESKSNPQTAQIQKRQARIEVTSSKTVTKQGTEIIFKAKITDRENYQNTELIHQNTSVIFKVNGRSVPDKFKKTDVYNSRVFEDDTSELYYTVPIDMAGIDSKGQTRKHIVTAIFNSKNYYPDIKNFTYFTVERSEIQFNLSECSKDVDNIVYITGKLEKSDPETDKIVRGRNKVGVKINGKTYIDPQTNKTKYWTVESNAFVFNFKVSKDIKIKRVMLITGERQGFYGTRAEYVPKATDGFTAYMNEISVDTDGTVYEEGTINEPYTEYYRKTKKVNLTIKFKRPVQIRIMDDLSVFRGVYKFYDNGVYMGSKNLTFENYFIYYNYIPFDYDGKDHVITIKYFDDSGRFRNTTYTKMIYRHHSERYNLTHVN